MDIFYPVIFGKVWKNDKNSILILFQLKLSHNNYMYSFNGIDILFYLSFSPLQNHRNIFDTIFQP